MSRKRLLLITLFFIFVGLLSEYLLWHVKKNDPFLIIMAPVLATAHALESLIPFLKTLSAMQNELCFVLPLTVVYFGLAGFWISKILTEEGFLKYLTLLCFAGFLMIVHWQALSYLHDLIRS